MGRRFSTQNFTILQHFSDKKILRKSTYLHYFSRFERYRIVHDFSEKKLNIHSRVGSIDIQEKEIVFTLAHCKIKVSKLN